MPAGSSREEQRQVRLRLICLNSPVGRDRSAAFGLQDRRQGLHARQVQPDGSYRYEITVNASRSPKDGTARLFGPFVHGTAAAPFLYLSVPNPAPDAEGWLRRLKIPLPHLSWDQISTRAENGTLTAHISGAGSGTVPLLGAGWAFDEPPDPQSTQQ